MPDAARTDLLDGLMRARRSVRGFRSDPVPRAVLERVFTLAGQAPSNCNVQPWVVHIVSGGSAERLRTLLHDHVAGGAQPSPDFELTGAYPGAYRTRQIDAAKALFAATGIAREDVPARTASFLRNFRFFDAPHAAFVFLPDWAGIREAADVGMWAEALMLALVAEGLASCPQGALSHHAAIVREALGVAPDNRLLFGLAFGYEDIAHPANTARTDRAPLGETTVFHD